MTENTIKEITSEINNFADELLTMYFAIHNIQEGIGIHPAKENQMKGDISSGKTKLRIKTTDDAQYLTANATQKIQWRIEYILMHLHKVALLTKNKDFVDKITSLITAVKNKGYCVTDIDTREWDCIK